MKPLFYVAGSVALFVAGFGTHYYWARPSTGSGGIVSSDASRQADLRRAAKLVRLTAWKWDFSSVYPRVVGTVVNGSDLTVRVFVTFNLYDRSGSQVDSTSGHIENLTPGSKGRFEAIPSLNAFSGNLNAKSWGRDLQARLVKIEVY